MYAEFKRRRHEMHFQGYHDNLPSPFRKGELVVIAKGTPIQTRKGVREAKRTYVVRVNHILPGRSIAYLDALRDRRYRDDLEKRGFDFTPLQAAYDANSEELYRGRVPLENPQIRWAGAGGYWHGVDVNHILTANGISQEEA
jgi:hypothetical protein